MNFKKSTFNVDKYCFVSRKTIQIISIFALTKPMHISQILLDLKGKTSCLMILKLMNEKSYN